MIENIKELWQHLDSDKKQQVLKTIATDSEFRPTDPEYIYNRWICGERIPEVNQESILKIIQNALKLQSEKLQQMVKKFEK